MSPPDSSGTAPTAGAETAPESAAAAADASRVTAGAAIALLGRGFHVFPIDHPDHPECIGLHGPNNPCDGERGKHPAVKWGTWAVTVTPQMITRAWAQRGGLANIAIACGPSGIVVLDEDEYGELQRWCAACSIVLPDTYTVTTGRGRHLYFRWDHSVTRIGNSKKAMPDFKIDVRGDGGYVIAEGSTHASGVTYTGNGAPIAELPEQVAALLLAGAGVNTDSANTNGANTEHAEQERGTRLSNASEDFLREHADPNTTTIGHGHRHHELVAYAGRLRNIGLDLNEALPTFRQRWLLCEQPDGQVLEARFHSPGCPYPVTWDEAEAKLRDVYGRYAAGQDPSDVDRQPAATGDDTIKAFKFLDGQRPTDVGNAARLLRHARGRIRYVHAWGKWIVYHNGRWIIDEKDALVTEAAKNVAKGLSQLAAKTAAAQGKAAAADIWQWALKSDTSGAIAAMIRLARGVDGIIVDHEDLDADPWILNCANGTVDLRTGKLRGHDPDDLCTLQAPVAYNPHATAPLWEACLQRWQPDESVRDYLQLRAGASATGVPTETVDVDYGSGGNGKSKFHGAVQHVLGPYAVVPHKSLLIAGRFEQHATVVADLFRKRLAVASETKAAETLDDEQVKNLTGGDRLSGRRMREDPWGFWPSHTLIMFSNHKPVVRGRDEGIWRRLRLVPWEVTIPEDERDEGLAAKLAAEAEGILTWIVDGAIRFNSAGLKPPEAVRVATSAYRRDEDVIGRFIADMFIIDTSENGLANSWVLSGRIAHELEGWCAEQGIDPPPRMNEVAATLRAKGCEDGGRRRIGTDRGTMWRGMALREEGGEK